MSDERQHTGAGGPRRPQSETPAGEGPRSRAAFGLGMLASAVLIGVPAVYFVRKARQQPRSVVVVSAPSGAPVAGSQGASHAIAVSAGLTRITTASDMATMAAMREDWRTAISNLGVAWHQAGTVGQYTDATNVEQVNAALAKVEAAEARVVEAIRRR
ncbi:MAG: hypothetical protein ACXU86_20780 [Archangium sp.]